MDYVQTNFGRIRKNSALYSLLESDCKKLFHLDEPTDQDIDMIFTMVYFTSETTKTVSAAEKVFPIQYHSLDYFESSAIDVQSARERLLYQLFPAENREQDISDSFLDFLKRFKAFVSEKMNRAEQELRQTIRARIQRDGLDTNAGRFKE